MEHLNRYGKPGQKVNCWTCGGHQNRGKQKQKKWILGKGVFGSIVWKDRMVRRYGAASIIKLSFPIEALLPLMHFVMPKAIKLQIFQACIGKMNSVKRRQVQK